MNQRPTPVANFLATQGLQYTTGGEPAFIETDFTTPLLPEDRPRQSRQSASSVPPGFVHPRMSQDYLNMTSCNSKRPLSANEMYRQTVIRDSQSLTRGGSLQNYSRGRSPVMVQSGINYGNIVPPLKVESGTFPSQSNQPFFRQYPNIAPRPERLSQLEQSQQRYMHGLQSGMSSVNAHEAAMMRPSFPTERNILQKMPSARQGTAVTNDTRQMFMSHMGQNQMQRNVVPQQPYFQAVTASNYYESFNKPNQPSQAWSARAAASSTITRPIKIEPGIESSSRQVAPTLPLDLIAHTKHNYDTGSPGFLPTQMRFKKEMVQEATDYSVMKTPNVGGEQALDCSIGKRPVVSKLYKHEDGDLEILNLSSHGNKKPMIPIPVCDIQQKVDAEFSTGSEKIPASSLPLNCSKRFVGNSLVESKENGSNVVGMNFVNAEKDVSKQFKGVEKELSFVVDKRPLDGPKPMDKIGQPALSPTDNSIKPQCHSSVRVTSFDQPVINQPKLLAQTFVNSDFEPPAQLHTKISIEQPVKVKFEQPAQVPVSISSEELAQVPVGAIIEQKFQEPVSIPDEPPAATPATFELPAETPVNITPETPAPQVPLSSSESIEHPAKMSEGVTSGQPSHVKDEVEQCVDDDKIEHRAWSPTHDKLDLTRVDSNAALSIAATNSVAVDVEYEEVEFVWDDYLEDCKATAVPATSFKHVECSIQNSFEKGMNLEIANKLPEGSYWVASILMSCGQLLRLRPLGCGEDGSADFWCDITTWDVHQLGWCSENSKTVCPPNDLQNKLKDWQSLLEITLKDAKTPPLYMLDKRTGSLLVDQIREGMFLEAQHEFEPDFVWLVRVIENVGGRLLLRYEGSESAAADYWLFYIHHRLHPIGWAAENDCQMKPPKILQDQRPEFDWSTFLEECLEAAKKSHPSHEIFKDQVEILNHEFVEGHKLEVLNLESSTFHAATISKVINNRYFIVEVDNLLGTSDRIRFCCHSGSSEIFPVSWCSSKSIALAPIPGYSNDPFDWTVYLHDQSAKAVPEDAFCPIPIDHDFENGMKLEAVNRQRPGQICAATVVDVVDRVMWLKLDYETSSTATYIFCIDSHDIFPIGWCESNNYPLKAPVRRVAVPKKKVVTPTVNHERQIDDKARSALYKQMKEADLKKSSGWCPKIYFNCRCFSGPYLSKGRLVQLPKSVGPGAVGLVMTTVLTKLISVAYKSSRVLRELQLEGKPNPNMHQQILRAKYKAKSYSAAVEVCLSSNQVESFCRDVCSRLLCCPNLISTESYSGNCPDKCSKLTKTKNHYQLGKKKRQIGRPPGGHSNLEEASKKPARKKKHRKLLLTLRKKHGLVGRVNSTSDEKEGGDDDSASTCSWERANVNGDEADGNELNGEKQKRTRGMPPPSDMQTRGVKLPRYSFERKTHKKVLLSTTQDNLPKPEPEVASMPQIIQTFKNEGPLKLPSNPLYWNVQEVVDYIKSTDCASLARLFKEQEIDGRSFLLLSLPTVQEHLEPKLGPAVKLCHQVERLKIAFFQQFTS